MIVRLHNITYRKTETLIVYLLILPLLFTVGDYNYEQGRSPEQRPLKMI